MNFKNINFLHNIVNEGTNVEANLTFIKFLKKLLKLIGVNVVDPEFLVTPQLILMFVMSHTLALSFCFMLFTDVPFGDKLEATCLFSGTYQGIHKLYSAVLFPNNYYQLIQILRNLHVKYLEDHVIGPVLKKICVYCTILFECLAIIFFGVVAAYTILPILLWKKYDLVTTIFPIHLPFINWHTPIGYAINTVNHLFCLCFGLTGIMTADAIFLYFVLHSIGYLEIFKCRVNKLDEVLESEPHDLQKIQEQFYASVQAHQEYISYIKSVDIIYSQLCLAQMVTSELCLTLSLLLTIWRKWIVGPFIALCGVFQILQYCVLGTVVTIQNEKASEIIYGMKWYLLPVRHQKLVILMILQAQTSTELNVGKIAKLNVATAMKVIKTTYTYVMMMLEFLA